MFLLISTNVFSGDIKARAIMNKVDARNDSLTLEQDMLLILISRNGKKRTRNIKSYSKKFGTDKYQIMFFKSPADVRNTAFLMHNYNVSGKDDNQWLYLPALKKVKRIPSADKSASFMGSDFSYYDMTDIDLEDYNFKLLKETEVRGKKAWMIEAIPRTSKVVNKSGYTKTILLVRQDNYIVVRSIGFMKNSKKKYFDIIHLHKQGGVWLPDEITMTTKKGKKTIHTSILKFSNIKLNKTINDSMFTSRRLKKGL